MSHWLSPQFHELASKNSKLMDWMRTNVKTIYVVRSPDKVLASTFVFEGGFRNSVPAPDRHNWLIDKASDWVRHVTEWMQDPRVLLMKFEDIIENPVQEIDRIEKFLNVPIRLADPILPPRLSSRWAGRLSRLRRCPPTTEILSLQAANPLTKLFSQEAITDFKSVVGPLSSRLGFQV